MRGSIPIASVGHGSGHGSPGLPATRLTFRQTNFACSGTAVHRTRSPFLNFLLREPSTVWSLSHLRGQLPAFVGKAGESSAECGLRIRAGCNPMRVPASHWWVRAGRPRSSGRSCGDRTRCESRQKMPARATSLMLRTPTGMPFSPRTGSSRQPGGSCMIRAASEARRSGAMVRGL